MILHADIFTGIEQSPMYYLVSDKMELILGWSAKSACTTLKNYFLKSHQEKFEDLVFVHTICTEKYEPPLSTAYQNFKKVLFIRNPYTRVVSFFLDRYVPDGADLGAIGLYTFEMFVNYIHSHGIVFDQHHLELQTEHMDRFDKLSFKWDNIYRIESITKELLESLLQVPVDELFLGPHLNIKHASHRADFACYNLSYSELMLLKENNVLPAYQYFFNADLKSKIRSIYKKDFEFFEKNRIYYDIPLPE